MSTGEFSGPLERLGVRGRTETPNFTLTAAGNEVPLTTEFDALVDGTSGDTILNSVRATLGESEIVTSGRVVRARDVKGRLIRVDARIDRGRLEDLLRLAVKGSQPPMSGIAKIRARLEIRNALLPPFNFYIDPATLVGFGALFEAPSTDEGAEVLVVRDPAARRPLDVQ